MTKKTESEVAIIDFTKFDIAQLPELKGKKDEIAKLIKANPVVEIMDNASYELAKKSRTAVRTLRTSLQSEKGDVKKRIKECVLDVVDAEYDLIIESVKIDENARQEPITAWETAKENERLEKARLEEERVTKIKDSIQDFKMDWSGRISELSFADLENFDVEFGETLVNYDKSVFQEFEVLFTDAVSNLTYMLSEKKATLVAQEKIRIDNLEIEEKNAENNRTLEWQRTWDANINTLAFDHLTDVKSTLLKSKLTNLKHYSNAYEAIYTSTEKRLHSQIELVSKAEEQRIAQEKFLAEKKEFEEKQAEAKFNERCKQLTDLGCIFSEEKSVYEKLGYHIHLDDVRGANDELWERELTDAKEIKTLVEVVEIPIEEKEVEYEELNSKNNYGALLEQVGEVKSDEIANSDYPFGNQDEKIFQNLAEEIAKPKEELTWDGIHDTFTEETEADYTSLNFLYWLEENYNCPTPKN